MNKPSIICEHETIGLISKRCEDCGKELSEKFIKDSQKPSTIEQDKYDGSGYCPVCGTCGYTGCCGVKSFLEKHVKGKTNCINEDVMIDEMISDWESFDEQLKSQKSQLIDEIVGLIEPEWEDPDIRGTFIEDKGEHAVYNPVVRNQFRQELKTKLIELKEKV